ncbi:hypothetical protein BsWGS_01185 [Bradybaena similaris]
MCHELHIMSVVTSTYVFLIVNVEFCMYINNYCTFHTHTHTKQVALVMDSKSLKVLKYFFCGDFISFTSTGLTSGQPRGGDYLFRNTCIHCSLAHICRPACDAFS